LAASIDQSCSRVAGIEPGSAIAPVLRRSHGGTKLMTTTE
jgi:hypothetical protein